VCAVLGRGVNGSKKSPEIIDAIRSIIDVDAAGDPMSEKKWTHQTAEKVADALSEERLSVSATVVRRLLHQMDYSLKSNRKCLSAGHCSDRDAQFNMIMALREEFEQAGDPIISVDTKKKELIGAFKNPGKVWCKEARKVKDHDFRSEAIGIAVPYGIYDPVRNSGLVVVGQSADTPEFAVNCILQWWRSHGNGYYPNSKRLLILADSGGSNGARTRTWKLFLQEKLADECGLTITVAHYPSGASKWNPIEHRMFSEVSKNWAGVPLDSFDTVVNYASSTQTKTGLRVASSHDQRTYQKGVKVSDKQMHTIATTKSESLPLLNYTIAPRMQAICTQPHSNNGATLHTPLSEQATRRDRKSA